MNKERLRESRRGYTNKWKEKNKEKVRIYNSEYHKKCYPEIKEKKSEYYKLWRLENKDSRNTYAREYRKKRINDVQFRLSKLLRTRLYHALKGNVKNGSAIKDLGCTVQDLKSHLEDRFKDGMDWNNWSYTGWHIDHIKPLALFDLTNRDQLLQAVHYTNLQPLWAEENKEKGSKFTA